MRAGEQSGVNPYVLASMIMQEQGKGTSPLISGNYAGYSGYYNFFNVEEMCIRDSGRPSPTL